MTDTAITSLSDSPSHAHLVAAVRLVDADQTPHAQWMLERRGVPARLIQVLVAVALHSDRDWLVGGHDAELVVDIAGDWYASGIPTDELEEWWRAGAFCGLSAGELHAAGLTPEDVTTRPSEYAETIAYSHSNDDISTDRAIELARAV